MIKTISKFLFVMTILSQANGYGQETGPHFILVINPVAQIKTELDPNDIVDRSILYFENRFPKELYDHLQQYTDCLDLRTQFDELIRLKEQLAGDNREEFIKGINDLLPYTPSAYLFVSIDKTISKVILHAEILNLSSKSLALAVQRISFTNFVNDDVVLLQIQKLGTKLKEQLCDVDESWISFGIGFGYQGDDHIQLNNIPSDIRLGRPHPDDLSRPDILDPDNQDNYFIFQNSVDLSLKHRISLNLHFRFWNIVNIALKSSSLKDSDIIEDRNLFRKSYITGNTGGDALTYYLVRSKKRSFFDAVNFSIPIYITYPVFKFGKKNEFITNILLGTNLVLPEKVTFEAEKGWHRYNSLQKDKTFDLGEIKETNFFTGLDIQADFIKLISFGLQLTFIYKEYQENFKVPLSLKVNNQQNLSVHLYLMKQLYF